VRIDRALRARFRDETLKHRILQYLLARTRAPHHFQEIDAAARLVDPLLEQAQRLAENYRVDGNVAYLEVKSSTPYDKTELLLLASNGRSSRSCATRGRSPSRRISNPVWTSSSSSIWAGACPRGFRARGSA